MQILTLRLYKLRDSRILQSLNYSNNFALMLSQLTHQAQLDSPFSKELVNDSPHYSHNLQVGLVQVLALVAQ